MLRTVITSLLIYFFISIATGFAQDSDEFHLDETYTIDPGATIHLNSDDAEVRIIGSERNDVRVVVHYQLEVRGITFGDSNEFEMIVEEQDGNLRIREMERDFGSSGMIGFSSEEYTIEIETPRDVNLQLVGNDEEHDPPRGGARRRLRHSRRHARRHHRRVGRGGAGLPLRAGRRSRRRGPAPSAGPGTP